MLDKLLELLHRIQSGPTGSMGSLNNVYLPQLDRHYIDALSLELKGYLSGVIDLGDHDVISVEEFERAWRQYISSAAGQRPVIIHETDLHSTAKPTQDSTPQG